MFRLLSYCFVALAVGMLGVVSAFGGDRLAATDRRATGPAVPPVVDPANPFTEAAASSPRAAAQTRTAPAPKKPATSVAQQTHLAPVEAIKRALDAPTQVEFVETPLKDVVDYLKDLHHIEIQLDSEALKEAGVDENTPITKNLKGILLRSALQSTLEQMPAGLTYVIRDEVLLITSKAKAENMRVTKVYDVADLVACQDSKAKFWDDYETLTDVIRKSVCPQSWDSNGGRGTVKGASLGATKVLVVWQTQQVHEEIAAVLEEIRAVAAKKRAGGEAGWPQRDPPK